MNDDLVVLRADDPRADDLLREGWRVTARSWGAELLESGVDATRLAGFVDGVGEVVTIRELGDADVDAILRLDASTAHDYPGSLATQHRQMQRDLATPSAVRRAFGAFAPSGELVAMSYVDVDGDTAETDFTVVARAWRGHRLSTCVKAASVLALLEVGVIRWRKGGSAENPAIIAANQALGYVIDEQWVTLERPATTSTR